jgi:hypothetical protein
MKQKRTKAPAPGKKPAKPAKSIPPQQKPQQRPPRIGVAPDVWEEAGDPNSGAEVFRRGAARLLAGVSEAYLAANTIARLVPDKNKQRHLAAIGTFIADFERIWWERGDYAKRVQAAVNVVGAFVETADEPPESRPALPFTILRQRLTIDTGVIACESLPPLVLAETMFIPRPEDIRALIAALEALYPYIDDPRDWATIAAFIEMLRRWLTMGAVPLQEFLSFIDRLFRFLRPMARFDGRLLRGALALLRDRIIPILARWAIAAEGGAAAGGAAAGGAAAGGAGAAGTTGGALLSALLIDLLAVLAAFAVGAAVGYLINHIKVNETQNVTDLLGDGLYAVYELWNYEESMLRALENTLLGVIGRLLDKINAGQSLTPQEQSDGFRAASTLINVANRKKALGLLPANLAQVEIDRAKRVLRHILGD